MAGRKGKGKGRRRNSSGIVPAIDCKSIQPCGFRLNIEEEATRRESAYIRATRSPSGRGG